MIFVNEPDPQTGILRSMNINPRLLSLAAPLIGALVASEASAETRATSIAVSAVVRDECSVAASPLAFGTYEPGQTGALDGTAQLQVTCSLGTSYSIGLGSGSSASPAQRTMTSADAGQLVYNLYQDSARSIVWGNTTGSNTVSGTYAAAQAPLPVYGRIAGGQVVTAGGYSDTITVTVTY